MKQACVILLLLLAVFGTVISAVDSAFSKISFVIDGDDKKEDVCKEPKTEKKDIIAGAGENEEMLLSCSGKPGLIRAFVFPFPFFDKQTPPPDCSC